MKTSRVPMPVAIGFLLLLGLMTAAFAAAYPTRLADADAVRQLTDNHEAHLTSVLMNVYQFPDWQYLPAEFLSLASSDDRYVNGLRYLPLTGQTARDRDKLLAQEQALDVLEHQIVAARGQPIVLLVDHWVEQLPTRRALEGALRHDLGMATLDPGQF